MEVKDRRGCLVGVRTKLTLLSLPCRSWCSALHEERGCWRWWTRGTQVCSPPKGVVADATFGTLLMSWPMALVFFKLVMRPKSAQAAVKQLTRHSNAASKWTTLPASSEEGSFLMSTLCTIVFEWRRARLKRPPSLLV